MSINDNRSISDSSGNCCDGTMEERLLLAPEIHNLNSLLLGPWCKMPFSRKTCKYFWCNFYTTLFKYFDWLKCYYLIKPSIKMADYVPLLLSSFQLNTIIAKCSPGSPGQVVMAEHSYDGITLYCIDRIFINQTVHKSA